MAQMQKVRVAQAKTQTTSRQVQSQEVIQMLLHGTLSILLWCRGIFPEKAFESKKLYLDGSYSYDDYAAPNQHAQRRDPGATSLPTEVLISGQSQRADAFLNWLKDGIFPALEACELELFQVRIHPSLADRQIVLETYTFTVTYLQDQENAGRTISIDMGTPGNGAVTLEASQKALHDSLLRVTRLCESMPALPESRFVTLKTKLNVLETNTQRNGWVSSNAEESTFPQEDGWHTLTHTMQLNAGLHNGAAFLKYLQPNDYKTFPATSGEEVDKYSLACNDEDMDTVLDSLPNISAPVNPIVLDNNPTTHAIPTQQTVEERHPGSGLRRSTRHADKREQTLPPSSQLTQSSNIQSMRGFLREARQSEHISQGATQQQAPFLPQQPASISSETESVVSGSPEKTRKDVPVSGYTQPTLGRIKALQLQTDKAAPRQAGASNIVQCTCGCAQVDMMMIRCSCCATLQHPHCYGFLGKDDPRIPSEHVCYTCLLRGVENSVLKELEQLSLQRRVMYFALLHGIMNKHDLAKSLTLGASVVGHVVDKLKDEGFLKDGPESKAAGSATQGKACILAVRAGPIVNKMLGKLFDPLLNIIHHYNVPDKPIASPSTFARKIRDLQSMLPPGPPQAATPGQASRAPTMTRTKLPHAPSLAVPETPTRPRFGQRASAKRTALQMNEGEEIQDAEVLPKVAKHYRFEETEFGLNANGQVPTSPAGPFLR